MAKCAKLNNFVDWEWKTETNSVHPVHQMETPNPNLTLTPTYSIAWKSLPYNLYDNNKCFVSSMKPP